MKNEKIIKWVNDEKTIQKSKKPYSHFDYKTDISQCWKYISNPENIEKHGFYPFIHYKQTQIKYSKKTGKKLKVRNICYAAHIDSCIYQYYSFLLNDMYNSRVKLDNIDNVSVAYRTDLGKSNIHFAKQAFDFIRKWDSCFIMIGDFTDFFDTLSHVYLKQQICNLMQVKELPNDYYAVFKNVTKYSMVELSDLLQLNKLNDTPAGRKRINNKEKIISTEEFRNNKSLNKKNQNSYGIPQGSPISALLANIYMLECDKEIHEFVKQNNGFYMRYSDDFMIIIPDVKISEMKAIYSTIKNILSSIPNLKLQPQKTQIYSYSNCIVKNKGKLFDNNLDDSNKLINFLGFSFDGKNIFIRDKTVSKYYYRMYRKAKTISNHRGYINGHRISNENIYNRYSVKGARKKPGNFITYVNRSNKEFNDDAISRSTKRHLQKIKKAIHNY